MEGSSNGGMLYHEVQESNLCAVHCVNTALQCPFFSEFDLAALASDLDRKERQMMMLLGCATNASGDFLSEESHNVSLVRDFRIQMAISSQKTGLPLRRCDLCHRVFLQKALEVWDLQVIPLDCPVTEPAQIDPELENAFICHLHDHWLCIRKVNGEWYNFDNLNAAPQNLSKFYLSAYLESLKGSGWSIFLIINPAPQCSDPFREAEMLSDWEDEDLKAAIAASLMDSSPAMASAGTPQDENQNSKEKISQE